MTHALQMADDFVLSHNCLSNINRCFILGSGPTLNKVKLDCLKNEIVIGVNGVLRSGFNPTFLCATSPNAIESDYIDIMLNSKSKLLMASRIVDSTLKDICISNSQLIKVFHLRCAKSYNFTSLYYGDLDEVMATESVVGDIALPLAVYLGIKNIYLLGLDGYRNPLKGNVRHFYKDNFHNYIRKYVFKNDCYAQMWFAKIDVLARLSGYKIYNLSPGSAVVAFERQDPTQLFPNLLDTTPLAVHDKYLIFDGETYEIVAANNGNKDAYSFKNTSTGMYIRHCGGKITYSDIVHGDEKFSDDSSFFVESSFISRDLVSLRSVNFPRRYVVKDVVEDSYSIQLIHTDFSVEESCFNITSEGTNYVDSSAH